MPTLRLRHLLLAILLAIAAHLRVIAVLETDVGWPIRNDAADYVSYAYNIHRFGIYSLHVSWHPNYRLAEPVPDAIRTPGYPLFLIPFLGDFPHEANFVLHVELAQAALSVLMVALCYALFAAFVPFGFAYAGALLIALTPQMVTGTTYLLSETLFGVWLVLGLLATVAARGPRRARWLFASGALFGLAALTRPTLQYLPIVWGVALWWPHRRAGGAREAAAFVLGFALLWTPWLVRNEITLGRSSDPKLTIGVLQEGSYPGLMYEDRPETRGYGWLADPRRHEIDASVGAAVRHIVEEFEQQPARMLRWYALEKAPMLFGWDSVVTKVDIFEYPTNASPYMTRPEFIATRDAMRAIHPLLMTLGAIGMLVVWWPRFAARLEPERREPLRLFSLMMLYVIAIHVVGLPLPRYSVPFRPLTILFALVLVAAVRRPIPVPIDARSR